MHRRLLQSACLGGVAALSACATPNYPTSTAAASAVVAPQPAPPPPPLAPAPNDSAIPAVGSGAVQSQPLAPPASAQPPVAEAPAYTPPEPPRTVTRVIAGGQVVAATRMFRDYTVRRGDHLDAIARDFEVAPDTLIEANHIKSPNQMRPGQHLKIPVAKAYVVASGDTITAVAKRFDIGVDDLASLNDLPVRGRLRAGDRLALPATFHDRGPTRTTETVMASRRVERYAPPPPSGQYAPGATVATNTPYVRPYEPPASRYAPIRAAPAGEATPTATDAQITAAGRGRFVWPLRGETLAKFGVQGMGRRNDGLDLKSPQGTVVRSAAAGEVVYAGNQVPGFGNLVLVKHADGWVTAYAHLDRASVQMRQTVTQGQELGQVGMSGGVAEPQLHFEVRYAAAPTDKARPIDPLLVLPE